MFLNRKIQHCQDVNSSSNLFYRFNVFPFKISESYFYGFNKLILNFIGRDKRLRIANAMLKKNKIRGLTQPNVKN